MGDIDPVVIEGMLKGIDRYNPENLSVLEPHVRNQISKNFYDRPANLAVLKLYQFNPTYFQEEIVCDILLKALQSLPGPDFSLCECLIDQYHHETQQIGRLIFLHHLLETCQFRLFWRELKATPELTESVMGFEESIRKFICQTVTNSHQHIRADTLKDLLGDLNDEEVEIWVQRYNWNKKDDLIFVTNQEEIIKSRNIVDKVNFDKVHSVMVSGLVS